MESAREDWKGPERGGESPGGVERAWDGWRGQEVLREARVFTGGQGSCTASENVGEVQ